jgi:poly-gamma-glutamate synthase PgsB/CapB
VTHSIAAMLRGQLDPLVARLRGPAIAALAARLTSCAAQPGLASLIVAVPAAVGELQDEHAAALARIAEIESEVHAATTAAEQREALARVIRREVRSPRGRRGDLRALSRDLDLDALRERISGELAAIEAQLELALGFIGRAAAPALASEPLAGSPLRRAGLPGFLVAQLTWSPRFPLRMAAVEALQRLCEALGPADPDRSIARAMTARVLDAEEHPWVQGAALAVLYMVAPSEALRLCGEILRAPHAGGGDVQIGVDDSLEASRSGVVLEGLDDLASGSFSREPMDLGGSEGAAEASLPDMTSEIGAWDSVTAGAAQGNLSGGAGDNQNTPPASAWVSLLDRITSEAPADRMRLVLGPSLLERLTAEASLPPGRGRAPRPSLFGRAAGPDPAVHEALRREADRERRAVAGEIGETRDAAEARGRAPAGPVTDGATAALADAVSEALAAELAASGSGQVATPGAPQPIAPVEDVDGALVVLAAVVRESALEHASEVDVDLSEPEEVEHDVNVAEDTGSWSIAGADEATPVDSGAWAAAEAERVHLASAATWADEQAAAMLSEGTAAVETTVTDPDASMSGAAASMSGAETSMSSAADLSLPSAVMAAMRGADASAPAPVAAALRGRRAFLLRRHAVDLLARRTRDRRAATQAVDMLAEAIVAGDPSEHVRIGLALAAAALPANELRAVVMLAALADPDRERSPVVRAWALRAAAGNPAAELLIGRSLELDASPLVLRIACAEAAKRGGATLAGALLELAARDDRPAAIHEAAAAALETIERQVDPVRAAWTATLAAALASTPPGQSTRVPLLRADLPTPGGRAWLGRIFAELTRNDWGVDVDIDATQLTIRRGDRWRPRLWRALHELRSPGPNKRQAHSHTRGRVLTGDLRVHSGVLHEVTGTGVPGERTQVEREGGWGRHLPLVDDLLGLPLWRPHPVQVVSSLGVCTISWRRGLPGRIAARLRLVARYAWLAELRLQALAADEPAQRGRYAHALRGAFGIELDFTAHPAPHMLSGTGQPQPRKLSAGLRALFPEPRGAPPPPTGAAHTATTATAATASWLVAPELVDWAWMHLHYFVSVSANSQQALAYFLAGLAAFGLVMAYLKNQQVARARAAIPLVIGGWGTRGKSGTERLKAGLLHGLGYSVFAKTTGCEAMFIHAPPRGPAREIYSFRPYGKATIWEQRELLRLAAQLRSDVFLWECMALSPAYVEVLQHSWMRDDLSTITNAYPDHEDIQGPAGVDVAHVIAGFVPTRGRLVTSEINFLPVMREAARGRSTTVIAIEDLAGELLPPDLLALFPYDEHPRNIALVARLAVELGLDPTLAIVTMAEHVVPDLGVLKRFGPARVRGRVLEFINGCSANERTGFLSNWRRTGCDQHDLSTQPDQYIITVVNNRDDRVSRSQVFARVLVEDVACDRHVLIGTNTHGLLGYIHAALDGFLAGQRVVTPEDLAGGTEAGLPARRLDALLARLRIVPRTPEALAGQFELFARGAGRLLPTAALAEAAERCGRWLADDEATALGFAEVYASTRADLGPWAEEALAAAPYTGPVEPPEVDVPATSAAAAEHFARQVARTVIAARLHARLRAALLAGPAAIEELHGELHAAYRELFLELVDIVEDPLTTGDQVVLRCALAVPPGVRVSLMGTQNIKGTGLDFVYRWIALDVAMQDLASLGSADPETRAAALRRLESPDDPGLLDSGLVAARLNARAPQPGEVELQTRARTAVAARHEARRAALGQRKQRGRAERLAAWAEGWVDFLDGARRHGRAKQVMRDLIDRRISHARAAQAMRELDSRAKGGWLVKAMRKP